MAMNWKYFLGASILAWGLLLKCGAPFGALAAGTLAAAAWNYWRTRPNTR
jgi:hypothetical protein